MDSSVDSGDGLSSLPTGCGDQLRLLRRHAYAAFDLLFQANTAADLDAAVASIARTSQALGSVPGLNLLPPDALLPPIGLSPDGLCHGPDSQDQTPGNDEFSHDDHLFLRRYVLELHLAIRIGRLERLMLRLPSRSE